MDKEAGNAFRLQELKLEMRLIVYYYQKKKMGKRQWSFASRVSRQI